MFCGSMLVSTKNKTYIMVLVLRLRILCLFTCYWFVYWFFSARTRVHAICECVWGLSFTCIHMYSYTYISSISSLFIVIHSSFSLYSLSMYSSCIPPLISLTPLLLLLVYGETAPCPPARTRRCKDGGWNGVS
jgi:hypothetical protein